jgi:hypothetical protein
MVFVATLSMAGIVACSGAGDRELWTASVDGGADVGPSSPSPSTDGSVDATALMDAISPSADANTSNGEAAADGAGEKVDSNAPFSGEPCPARSINVNCSASCGGDSAACSMAKCQGGNQTSFVEITSYSQLPFVLRTPDHPGVDPACPPCAQGAKPAYAMLVRINLPFVNHGLRITVGAPWRVGTYFSSDPFCVLGAPKSGCRYVSVGSFDLLVSTDDPNAEARNVMIEDAPSSSPCP